jgi:hypothetical protein
VAYRARVGAGKEPRPTVGDRVNREQRERLARALEYQERGLPLLPIAPQRNGGKQPAFTVLKSVLGSTSWRPLADRAASRPEIQYWFELNPDINIGIICGKASGLVVADVDYPGKAKLHHPPTPSATTTRGRHHFFRGQGTGKTFKWGELKGDGSYVVAPPARGRTWTISLDAVEPRPIEELISDGVPVNLNVSVARTSKEGTTTSVHPSAQNSSYLEGEPNATNAAAVERALAVLGIPSLKGKFSCVLPGHGPDRNASAAIHQDFDRIFRYKDFHRPDDPASLTLAEIRASLAAGAILRLRGPSQARWYRRLFYEAGVLKVERSPLNAEGCSQDARKVAQGFSLLHDLRAIDDDEPMPFARAFAGPWCGMHPLAAYRGLRELHARGVIVKAAMHGRTRLWLPAEPTTKRRPA